tara:strand:+ start:1902 stop:2114 length:213 start_codon:yes stop_codon:yes gene_type:complete
MAGHQIAIAGNGPGADAAFRGRSGIKIGIAANAGGGGAADIGGIGAVQIRHQALGQHMAAPSRVICASPS